MLPGPQKGRRVKNLSKLIYNWFHIKGTLGVYTRSMETIYLSLGHTGSWGTFFMKYPVYKSPNTPFNQLHWVPRATLRRPPRSAPAIASWTGSPAPTVWTAPAPPAPASPACWGRTWRRRSRCSGCWSWPPAQPSCRQLGSAGGLSPTSLKWNLKLELEIINLTF